MSNESPRPSLDVCCAGTSPSVEPIAKATFATTVLLDLSDLYEILAKRVPAKGDRVLPARLVLTACSNPNSALSHVLKIKDVDKYQSGPNATFEQALVRLTAAVAREVMTAHHTHRALVANLLSLTTDSFDDLNEVSGPDLRRRMDTSSPDNPFDKAMTKLIQAFGQDMNGTCRGVHIMVESLREVDSPGASNQCGVGKTQKRREIRVGLASENDDADFRSYVASQNFDGAIQALVTERAERVRRVLEEESAILAPMARYVEFALPTRKRSDE